MGRAARDLIQTPAYLDAMRAQEAFHVTAMLATPEGPTGTETREHHHRMLAALRDLHGELSGRALAAAEIEQRLALEADAEEDEIE